MADEQIVVAARVSGRRHAELACRNSCRGSTRAQSRRERRPAAVSPRPRHRTASKPARARRCGSSRIVTCGENTCAPDAVDQERGLAIEAAAADRVDTMPDQAGRDRCFVDAPGNRASRAAARPAGARCAHQRCDRLAPPLRDRTAGAPTMYQSSRCIAPSSSPITAQYGAVARARDSHRRIRCCSHTHELGLVPRYRLHRSELFRRGSTLQAPRLRIHARGRSPPRPTASRGDTGRGRSSSARAVPGRRARHSRPLPCSVRSSAPWPRCPRLAAGAKSAVLRVPSPCSPT